MLTYHKVTGHKIGVIDTDADIKIRNNHELRFYDDGDNYVGFEAPALSANKIWVLPSADGSDEQVLRTNGLGTLSWATAAAGASGVVELDDTEEDNTLTFKWNEDGGGDYLLNWVVGATRTITLSGNPTLADWFDQAVKAASNVSFGTVGCGAVTSTGTGSFAGASVTVGDTDTAGTLILSDGSAHTITIDVPSIAGSWTLTLPTTDGDANQYMKTDGSGNLSWVAAPEVVGHNMSTHGDEDTYTISTSGDLTVDDAVVDKIEVNECLTFDSFQTDTGDGDNTIDWGLGNNMYFTFGAQNCIIRFTAPPGSAVVRMIIKQDGSGSRTIDWSNVANILWPGNVEPTLSTGANEVDIITFLYDGTSWHGLFNGNFS